MRIVLALSLLVLQHAAPGCSRVMRPLPSPRRADAALANQELTDLLLPLLDHLDDSGHDTKRKRLLEIMPVPKGKSKKTPLLILASEIPTNIDPADFDTNSNVINVKLNDRRETISRPKQREESDSNEIDVDENEKELHVKSRHNSNTVNSGDESEHVKAHSDHDENKKNLLNNMADESSGEENDDLDIEQLVSELLDNLSAEKQSNVQVLVDTSKLSSAEESVENVSVQNKNHVHSKTIKSSDINSEPEIIGTDEKEIAEYIEKNAKPVKLNSGNQDLALKPVNKPQSDTSTIKQNENVVVVPSDNKESEDDEPDTNYVIQDVTSNIVVATKGKTETGKSPGVLLQLSESNKVSTQQVNEKTNSAAAVVSLNKEVSIDKSPKSSNVLKNVGTVPQSKEVVSTVGVPGDKEVAVEKPSDIRVKVRDDNEFLLVSRKNKVLVIKPSEIDVDIEEDDSSLSSRENAVVVTKPRHIRVTVYDHDDALRVSRENEVVVIKPSEIDVKVHNDDDLLDVTSSNKVRVTKPRGIKVDVSDGGHAPSQNLNQGHSKSVNKDLIKNKNDDTNHGDVKATIEVTGDQSADDVLQNGSLEEILRAIGEIGHNRIADVSANKCDRIYDREELKGVHKSFNLSFRFNK